MKKILVLLLSVIVCSAAFVFISCDEDKGGGNPPAECVDGDGDGYGTGTDCLGPDCDDSDANVHPGADEICGNDTDDNCDGETDEEACSCPAGFDDCGGVCVNFSSNVNHCGGCDIPCGGGPNATPVCNGSECGLVCDNGFFNCDPGVPGCESTSACE